MNDSEASSPPSPDRTATPTIEERIETVEALLQVHLADLNSDHELSESVDGLRVSAATLAESIRQSVRTQKAIFGLKRDVEDLEDKALMKHEMEEEVERIRKERHEDRTRTRTMFWVSIVTFVLSAIALVGIGYIWIENETTAQAQRSDASFTICQQRNDQAAKMQQYLEGQIEQIEALPEGEQKTRLLKDAAILQSAFPIINCEPLK